MAMWEIYFISPCDFFSSYLFCTGLTSLVGFHMDPNTLQYRVSMINHILLFINVLFYFWVSRDQGTMSIGLSVSLLLMRLFPQVDHFNANQELIVPLIFSCLCHKQWRITNGDWQTGSSTSVPAWCQAPCKRWILDERKMAQPAMQGP